MRNLVIYLILIIISLIDFQLIAQEAINTKSDPNTPIFEIKNDQEQTVFAVYPGGVKIFIDEQLKAAGGGFTVGRLNTGKASAGDILTVNPNNVNIIIDDGTGAKAAGGGFTVGRLNTGKAGSGVDNFLSVSPDSTRIYTNESSNKGFAVGKLNLELGSEDFLNLTPQNYFIGHRAGESITSGLYNTFIGYETGLKTASPNGNMFIGFNAGHENTVGALNIFIGNEVGYNFTGTEDGEENIFIGNNAGYNCPTTANSIFIGTRSGYNCGQSYGNTFIGDRTASIGTAGDNNTIIGSMAGFRTDGKENVFLGAFAGVASTTGANNTFLGFNAGLHNSEGNNNVFIGNAAGENELGSNKLYIANTNTENPLIYGDFLEKFINISGGLLVNGEIISPSDQRLKTNILKFTNGLDAVMALNSYYFNWNNIALTQLGMSDRKQIGVMAQEIEKILPELVTENPKNGYKSVDYVKLTPVLLQAIKEQQQEIETLKEENKKIKEQDVLIQNLQKRVEKLEALNESLVNDHKVVEQLKSDIEGLKALMYEKSEK